jgi:hypothetical protein
MRAQTIASEKILKIFSIRFFGATRRVSSFVPLARHACKSIANDGRQQCAATKSLFFSMKMRVARGARLVKPVARRRLASRRCRASEAETTPAS